MLSTRLFMIGVALLIFFQVTPSEWHSGARESMDRPAETVSRASEKPRTGTAEIQGIGPKRIDANPDAGFEYPYYLFAPEPNRDSSTPILVEPNNSPGPSDNFDVHLKEVKTKVKRGLGRHISDELAVPLLIPVFPRPVNDPVSWTHYVHSLDLETMKIEDGSLKRIDRQLLRMVADARKRLERAGYAIDDEIMLNGFSASGNFANRFAALHPEKVLSVTAGGINGMPILPHKGVKGTPFGDGDPYPLTYHVGVANIETLTGSSFNRSAFRDVHQYLYIGENDENDALLYPDPFTGKEVRLAALFAYGEDIHEERFPRAKAAYEEINADAVFRMYENAGHTPAPATDDVVEFHRRTLAGDSIEAIRQDLGGNVPEPSKEIRLQR